jgi:hypothetical protein
MHSILLAAFLALATAGAQAQSSAHVRRDVQNAPALSGLLGDQG